MGQIGVELKICLRLAVEATATSLIPRRPGGKPHSPKSSNLPCGITFAYCAVTTCDRNTPANALRRSSHVHVMTPREVLALCRQKDLRAVDLRFMDFPGTQKHFTIPVTGPDREEF